MKNGNMSRNRKVNALVLITSNFESSFVLGFIRVLCLCATCEAFHSIFKMPRQQASVSSQAFASVLLGRRGVTDASTFPLSRYVLEEESRLPRHSRLSRGGQVLLLLAHGDTLGTTNNLSTLTTLLNDNHLHNSALLHGLLEVGHHVEEDLLLVEGELALEDCAGLDAGLEGLLQLLDKRHGALGLSLGDGLADGAHVKGHVGEILANGLDDAVLPRRVLEGEEDAELLGCLDVVALERKLDQYVFFEGVE